MKKPRAAAPVPVVPVPLRLLDITEVATYFRCSTWVIRNWIERGFLRPLELPSTARRRPQDRRLRRLLFDVRDVERFVDQAKERM
jgi:hypothetical protein